MSDTVRARYMGNEADMRVEEEEIHLLNRHVYELPRSVVEGREDFVIQEEDVDEEAPPKADETPKKTKAPDTTGRKSEPRETATDRLPREER